MKELTLLYTHAERIGYGRMGIKLAEALRAEHVDVYERQGINTEDHIEAEGPAKLTNLLCTVSYASHLRGYYDDQTKVCYTMFEATRLPESFRECLHEYEMVLVPSDQNVELFGAFHDNVHKVPLGVDPIVWKHQDRTEPGLFFDFLCGGTGARKGGDLAAEAFTKAFPSRVTDGAIPRLILKSPHPVEIASRNIEQRNSYITAEEEVALYAAAHCYVQPSRGEGFGLQPLQAICQGLPTILTDAHGHADFARYGWGIPAKLGKAEYFMLGDAGEWWEPDLDALIDRMRWVYNNYDEAKTAARFSGDAARSRFTWRHTARQFVETIGAGQFDVPYSGSGDWREPVLRLYRARTLRDYRCEIAGATYELRAGVDRFVTADAKRVLMESNVLDPECLSADEPGVLPHMVDAYQERHMYCPHCGVRSGSGVTKADDIYARMLAEDGQVVSA